MNRKYLLAFDDIQADVLIEALELYSRLASGQYEELRTMRLVLPTDWDAWHRENNALIGKLKQLHFGLLPNESHSISSNEVPFAGRLAYELEQVIRKQVATDRGYQDLYVHHVWLYNFRSVTTHPYVAQIERMEESTNRSLEKL